MAKRKHSEMIKAWADNNELVALAKFGTTCILASSPSWDEEYKYFLCLPKHKDAVLALLNGGEAEVLVGYGIDSKPRWADCYLPSNKEWENYGWYMSESLESRVKPKKQTRYAYATPDGGITVHYSTKDELERYCIGMLGVNGFQLVTFEIEV